MVTQSVVSNGKNIGKLKWGMTIDIDKCTGCQACVLACQVENNVALNTAERFENGRVISWIRVERYWEGEFPDIKARFIPILCQQCGNAPCEPVCPVYATYHSEDGLNLQIYNRCVGTRYCANACPYLVRFFNYWQPNWPEEFRNHLNPDVTVRDRGVMEKCSFCIQRIRKGVAQVEAENRTLVDGEIQTACQEACPTEAIVFGNLNDPQSKVLRLRSDDRKYTLLPHLNTEPSVAYLAKVDPQKTSAGATH